MGFFRVGNWLRGRFICVQTNIRKHEQCHANATDFHRLIDIDVLAQRLCQRGRNSRGLFHLQFGPSRTGFFQARAFFREREEKREHGQKVCERVYKKWPNVKIKLVGPFQKAYLTDIEFDVDWKKGHSKSGEVILEERKPEYYGYQHLESGYKPALNAIAELARTIKSYDNTADRNGSEIKDALAKQVKKRMTLSEKITDFFGDSYDLEFLCQKTIERVLLETDLSFLNKDDYVGPTAQGYWTLSLDGRILSRTRDQVDADRLRESVKAVIADPALKDQLQRYASNYAALVKALESFKATMNDLINAIEFGRTIQGKCEICEDLAVLE